MRSLSYIQGMLDALVKSGAVSPAYGEGAADTLSKCAWWWSDGPSLENMNAAAQDWVNKNPGKQMPLDTAQKIFRKNRGDYAGVPWWHKFKNRVGANTTWLPGSTMTRDYYDRRLANAENEADLGVIRDFENKGMQLQPHLRAALMDAHSRDASFVEQDSQKYMTLPERERAGFTDGTLAGKFRTAGGDIAVKGTDYQPAHFKAPGPDPTAQKYGGPTVSRQFGDKRNLVFNRGYYDPSRL